MGGAAQDLRGAGAEEHVLGLDAVLLGDELGDLGARSELIPSQLAEAAAHGVEHGLAGTERVLVAGQDHRAVGRCPALRESRLEVQVEETGFTATAGHPESGGARACGLYESTSRQRHS